MKTRGSAKRESAEKEVALGKAIEQMGEYLSLAATCSACGEKIAGEYAADARAVVAVAIEWSGETPTLLQRMTVCDVCAADREEFKLPNPLYRPKGSWRDRLPPQLLESLRASDAAGEAAEASIEAELVKEAREKSAQRGPLEAEIRELQQTLLHTENPARRAAIRKVLDRKLEQLASDWNDVLDEGVASSVREVAVGNAADLDRASGSPEEEDSPLLADDQDHRDSIGRFLVSPYVEKLGRELRPIAALYAVGVSEAQIGKLLGFSQSTVSRRLPAIKAEAARRR